MQTNGPGKYNDIATEIRERTKARGIILIIVGGTQGQGFAVQGDALSLAIMPQAIRHVADQMDKDFATPKRK